MKQISIYFLVICSILMSACANKPVTKYGDSKAVETVSNEFGSTDLQLIAESMVGSLLQTRILDGRPTMNFSGIKNKTSEYIDTSLISQKIRTRLLKSGSVSFVVDGTELDAQKGELDRQNQAGLYDASTAAKTGKLVGAKYRLNGDIGSIVKTNQGVKDVFYQFTLSLIDVQTGNIAWQDEKEIRKTTRK